MKIFFILRSLAFLNQASYSQSDSVKRKFADTEPIIMRYRASCQKAWTDNKIKLAYTYYDSIANCIKNSYVDNYKFTTIDSKKYEVGKTKKPIFLTVSATWCEPCRVEIPALNKIADEYSDKVDFLVLFWDLKKDLDSLAPKYNPKIYLIPSLKKSVDEAHTIDISGFRNINGYLSMFLINKNNQIISYQTGASIPGSFVNKKGETITNTEEDAYRINYKRLKEEIEILLKNKGD